MVHTFEVRVLVHIDDLEDEDNSPQAKRKDLIEDMASFIPYDISDLQVSPPR